MDTKQASCDNSAKQCEMEESGMEDRNIYRGELSRSRDLALMFQEMGDFEGVLRHSVGPAAAWDFESVCVRIEALKATGKHEAAMELCELAMGQLGGNHYFLAKAGYVCALTGDWQSCFHINAIVSGGFDIRPDLARWQGEPLAGKRILVSCYLMGHGDNIQYAQFIPRLAQTGAEIVVQCRDELARLFARLPGVLEVVNFEALPACDFKAGVSEIPYWLGIKNNDMPGAPYLSGEEIERSARMREASALHVGITWGCKGEALTMKRGCRLSEMALLASVPGIKLYSLEKGPARKDLSAITGFEVSDLAGQLHDFADTADAIDSLDAVVAVDSAVANLVGAMGKPLFVLTPTFTDPRWGSGKGSPWYESAKVYRQAVAGEWDDPISRIVEDLKRLSICKLGATQTLGGQQHGQ